MIISFKISKEQKEVLLLRYPSIKHFVEKTISDIVDKITIEKDLFDVDKELKEYHDRRILNGYDPKRRKMTQATKDKISKTLLATSKRQGWKGMHLLPETIAKMEGHIVTQETRDLISKGNKGQKRTEEQRINIGLGHKGMKYFKRGSEVK